MKISQKTAYYAAQYNTRADPAIAQATLDRWAAQGLQARKTMAGILNIAYGGEQQNADEYVDYFPTAQSGAPLLIFIHGGWWRFLNKSDFSWVAQSFVAAGYNVAVTHYDLCPTVTVHTIVEQQLRALAYLYRHAQALEFDATRIHIAGHSAGAHLAAMMCCADWSMYGKDLPRHLLCSATLISGIYDLAPLTYLSAAQADLQLSTADIERLSPLSYAPSCVPSLICAGGLESEEFTRQSQLLMQHWGSNTQTRAADDLTHFTVVDDWASPQGTLHAAALAFMRSKESAARS
jgi:arylformamidase